MVPASKSCSFRYRHLHIHDYPRPGMTRTLVSLLVILTTAALSLGCSSENPAPGAWGQGIYIPVAWQTTREVEGHQVHVLQEKVACTQCHDLTETEIGPVIPQKCGECHEKESKIAHASEQATSEYGAGVTANCLDCHIFTLPRGEGPHTEVLEAFSASDCLRCHSQQQGDVAPVTIHKPDNCLACHAPHEQATPEPASCDQCHKDATTFHPAAADDLVKRCTTCHDKQHAPASDAIESCVTCHAEVPPIIQPTALFDAGHRQCIGCHRPHEADGASLADCRSCHEGVSVLAAAFTKGHHDCTGCHSPHDVKAASATGCSGCHTSVKPNHPKHGKAGTCTGCHDPHPGANLAMNKVRDCSTCHTTAQSERAFHGATACRDCHSPHDFLLAAKGVSLCSNCHSENVAQIGTQPDHAECKSCHGGLPHRPDKLLKDCRSCHESDHTEATAGHKNCLGCHDAHGNELARDCADCHKEEQHSAPLAHQECVNCHQPHTGTTDKHTCSSCHKEEANTPHGRIAANCNDCHRPHGPDGTKSPPSCSSCHQSSELMGLHAEPKHRQCTDCHSPHGELNMPQRAACISCHQDRQEHFPAGASCSSCHLFVRAK